MKKYFLFVLVLFFVTGFSFANDSAEGFWISVDEKTEKETAGWKIWVENDVLYGKILSAADTTLDDTAGGKGKSYDNFQNGIDVSTFNLGEEFVEKKFIPRKNAPTNLTDNFFYFPRKVPFDLH